jgi:hypothetical protein
MRNASDLCAVSLEFRPFTTGSDRRILWNFASVKQHGRMTEDQIACVCLLLSSSLLNKRLKMAATNSAPCFAL